MMTQISEALKEYTEQVEAWERLGVLADAPNYEEWLEQQYAHYQRDKQIWHARWKRKTELVHAYRKFISEQVEPLRKLAMDISMKHEPCGYYCDPDEYGGGHHDHQLFNAGKFLYGNGIDDYVPEPELWKRLR